VVWHHDHPGEHASTMTDFDLSFVPALYTPSALLPIARHRASLLYTVESHQVTVIVGQTGSGKTTQLPQYLDQAGWTSDGKCIAITQVGKLTYFQSRLCLTSFASPGEWLSPRWLLESQRR
jgi:hypothetical protein